jgi:hypothetical protein
MAGAVLPRLPKLRGKDFEEKWITVGDTTCPSGQRLGLQVVGTGHYYIGALTNFLSVGDICPSEMQFTPTGTFVHHIPVDGDEVRVTYGYRAHCRIAD